MSWKKPILIAKLDSSQVEEFDGTAVDSWCELCLEADENPPLDYDVEGIKDATEVIERTTFYVGHLRGRLAIFANPDSASTLAPSKDDWIFDSDDGWQKVTEV